MIATRTALSAAAALLVACGGAPPEVPPAPPVEAACKPLQAGEQPALPPPSAGPELGRLRPSHGPPAGVPMAPEALLKLERPPTVEQWRALPPPADAVLLGVASDAAAPPEQRVRAMSGLAVRRTPAADAPARAALADPQVDPVVRRGAARALAAGWLEPERGPVLDALTTALADADPLTREAVVKALAPHAARPAVRDALAARLPKEDAPLVREAIEQALKTETP